MVVAGLFCLHAMGVQGDQLQAVHRPVQDRPIVEKCDAYSGKRRNFDI